MPKLPDGFEFEGVYVYRIGDTFFYIPGPPDAERSPSGEPTLSVMGTDTYGFLQLGAEWTVEQSVLDRLTKQIARKYQDVAGPVKLAMAPVSVSSVDLVFQPEGGEPQVLQSQTQVSSIGPVKALFNASLDQSRRGPVLEALHGGKGTLKVVVNATLRKNVDATFKLSGDVSRQLRSLNSDSTVDDTRKLVDEALESRALKGELVAGDDAPSALITQASEMAKTKAAQAIQRMITDRDLDTAGVQTEAVARDAVQIPLTRESKVSDWFAGGARPRVYTTAGVPD